MTEAAMAEIAEIMRLTLENPNDTRAHEEARARVAALCAAYPL